MILRLISDDQIDVIFLKYVTGIMYECVWSVRPFYGMLEKSHAHTRQSSLFQKIIVSCTQKGGKAIYIQCCEEEMEIIINIFFSN